ncbi:50S ribosomal protein L30e [Candidatus Micrarchaeota archaeon]|nr:50S ribosomal protein L30e [Candidatus Micrarchaeota archaeon]
MMDLERSIRLAVDSGKVSLGSQKSLEHARRGDAKLLIMAQNTPAGLAEDLKHFCSLSDLRLVQFKGTSMQLGTVCGKPFPVSALSVIEPGDSDILDAAASGA